tara:strand:- start:3082 stop:3573 length:492 start_codon:yes stop_codon:yes gene_type:complete
MPNVSLFTKFSYTDGRGNVFTDGSTTSAITISAASDEVFDRTYSVTDTTIKELWNDTLMADFDFLYIISTVDAEIQLMCSEGGTLSSGNIQNAFCLKLLAGKPFFLCTDDSRNMGNMNGTFDETNHGNEIDTWETNWVVDQIDRVEYYQSSGGSGLVRVFAVT